MELKEAIQKRRSEREFGEGSLTKEELDLLQWSASKRPSAGALYPIDILLATNFEGEVISALGVKRSIIPYAFILVGNYKKICEKYGDRGILYTYLEAGHMAQNMSLMAVELELSCYCIGAFSPQALRDICPIKPNEYPLYIVAIGRKKC